MKRLLFIIFIFSFIISSCSKQDANTSNQKDPSDQKKPDPIQDADNPNNPSIDISSYFVSIGNGEDERPLMNCTKYDDEIIKAINDSLVITIHKAQTKREKVIAAAKFVVSFKTVIPYAYETAGEEYKFICRYTRKGLFLKNVVENGYTYPAWGCDAKTPQVYIDRYKNLGATFKNGLHCSSFVGWCLYNAGVADASVLDKTWANNYRTFPLSTEKNLKDALNLIQPGDLLWFDGHIALVIGVDGDTVLIAESAIWGSNHTDPRNGSRWRTFNKKTTNFDTFRFKSLIQMDGVYE